MSGVTFDKISFSCHQCKHGYCVVDVFTSEPDNFDTVPQNCLYMTKIKPIWIEV